MQYQLYCTHIFYLENKGCKYKVFWNAFFRKTTLKQEDKPHLQCGQEEMTKTTDIKFDFKFGRFDNVGRQQEIL